jgi:hypothetical protein
MSFMPGFLDPSRAAAVFLVMILSSLWSWTQKWFYSYNEYDLCLVTYYHVAYSLVASFTVWRKALLSVNESIMEKL